MYMHTAKANMFAVPRTVQAHQTAWLLRQFVHSGVELVTGHWHLYCTRSE